jgi:hypothetical protein
MEICRELSLFADYFQIHLMDLRSNEDPGAAWTDEAVDRMLAVGETWAGLGTLRNVTVPLTVHVTARAPDLDLGQYDHAVSGSISVPSGELVVLGCTDSLEEAEKLHVEPGMYELLYLASGIESITYESDPADDRYIVYLWPGSERSPRLLKHWRPSA